VRTRIVYSLPYVMIACAVAGIGMMQSYMITPGAAGEVPDTWPGGSGIERDADRWTLVVAVHPMCPCTEASAEELGRAIRGADERPELIAIVRVPPDPDEAERWMNSPLVRALRRVDGGDGLRVIRDETGEIAAVFGALTSGHAVLFDPAGARRFSGGVTPSRGMRGPNTGAAAIGALLDGREAPATSAAVYGCPLCDAAETDSADRRDPAEPLNVELPSDGARHDGTALGGADNGGTDP